MRSARSAVGGCIMNTSGVMEVFLVFFFIFCNDPNISFHLFLSSAEQCIDVSTEVSVTTPRTLSWVVKTNSVPITIYIKVGLFAFIHIEYCLSISFPVITITISCNSFFFQCHEQPIISNKLFVHFFVVFKQFWLCGRAQALCCCLWRGFSWAVGFFSSAFVFVTSPPSQGFFDLLLLQGC